MLTGCMIDGFGWFAEADYRRSWLLLDRVDYVFPASVLGPLSYDLGDRAEYVVARPRVFTEELSAVVARDAADPFLIDVVRRVPRADTDYARMAVWCDEEARDGLRLADPPSAELSVAYLLNKLTSYAQTTGSSPIVGRSYAADLLSWKVRGATDGLAWNRAAAKQRVRLGAFAAGMSLDFLSDDDLEHADFDRLVALKQRHKGLLERSQRAVIDLSSTFESLPDSPQFDADLGKLRAAAAKEREHLEDLGREAWVEAGLKITKRALAAGAAVLGGSLVLVSTPHALLAAAAAVVGAAGPELVDTFEKRLKASPLRFSFLMKTGGWLGPGAASPA